MFNFQLKRPIPEDFKYIYLINSKLFGKNCFSEFHSRRIFENILNDSKGYFIAVTHAKRIVGYAYAAEVFSFSFGHHANVVDFVTLDYYRSNGADVCLLRALELWASDVVCSEIRFNPDDNVREDLLKQFGYIKDEDSRLYRKQL